MCIFPQNRHVTHNNSTLHIGKFNQSPELIDLLEAGIKDNTLPTASLDSLADLNVYSLIIWTLNQLLSKQLQGESRSNHNEPTTSLNSFFAISNVETAAKRVTNPVAGCLAPCLQKPR